MAAVLTPFVGLVPCQQLAITYTIDGENLIVKLSVFYRTVIDIKTICQISESV